MPKVRHNLLLKAVGVVVGVGFSGTLTRIACLSEDEDLPCHFLESVVPLYMALYMAWQSYKLYRTSGCAMN